MDRRQFIRRWGVLGAASVLMPNALAMVEMQAESPLFFDISLAQWSLHRQLRSGALSALEFPVKTQKVFGIRAVEYVNQFFHDKAEDVAFLSQLKGRCDDHGVTSLLIMIDGEGHLGAPLESERLQAVENHYKWVDAAKYLGCHSIRVNITGDGNSADVQSAAVDGLSRLCEFAATRDMNIIVENNVGYASSGSWLARVLRDVGRDNCGSLPDFGNFGDYDRYQGVTDLMPYAKGISAKSFEFDSAGNELQTDFLKMLTIIKHAGYKGYIGVEFEGAGDEDSGVMATKELLLRLGRTLS
jgi:sugar phosphate isomerase/epimerase